ncbi:IS3 family transposase [Clostridium sp. JNZ X4-2]
MNDKNIQPETLEEGSVASNAKQENILSKPDKYAQLRNHISKIFTGNKGCYGYRRIYGMLAKEGCTVSVKIVR